MNDINGFLVPTLERIGTRVFVVADDETRGDGIAGAEVVFIRAARCPGYTSSQSGPHLCPLHRGHLGSCWAATPELVAELIGPIALVAAPS